MTRRLERILVSEFDSLAQRGFFVEGPTRGMARVVGAARAALLLGGRILVTDAMLLDGEILLRLGPEALASALGAGSGVLPIVRTSTHATLNDALSAMLADPEFRWQVAPSQDARTSPELAARWHRWIDADVDGRIPYEPQPAPGAGHTEWDLDARLHPVPSAFTGRVAEAAALLAGLATRSAMVAALPSLDVSEAERAMLATWWNGAYLDAMAAQHRASWISLSTEMASTRRVVDPRRSGDFSIPTGLARELQNMPSGAFSLTAYTSRKASARFQEKPTRPNLRKVAYVVSTVADPPSRASVIVWSSLRFGFAMLAFLLGTLLLPNLGNDELVTGLLLATLAVITVPWDDLWTICSIWRGETGLLSTGGGGE